MLNGPKATPGKQIARQRQTRYNNYHIEASMNEFAGEVVIIEDGDRGLKSYVKVASIGYYSKHRLQMEKPSATAMQCRRCGPAPAR